MTDARMLQAGGPCACGCCAGVTARTPVRVRNRPGLSAIAYRVGSHALFKQSLLAALSSARRPGLAALGTRSDDDVSIALLDGWATIADVLTFYQERIANESYLGTATERRSLLELARLIGYRLHPGVAAGTHLAFTLETAAGSPRSVTIERGVRVQSVPGADELPQTFETTAPLQARAAWGALGPLLSRPQPMRRGLRELFLSGVTTRLEPGDAILIVGSEREAYTGSERWDFRLLDTAEEDATADRTRVTWLEPLGHDKPVEPAAHGVRILTFRGRAALFGHNAPDPRILKITDPAIAVGDTWQGFALDPTRIDLDAVYPRVTAGSWVVFDSPSYREVARVATVTSLSDARFGLSGKFTRIVPDAFENSRLFDRRTTTVHIEADPLVLAERPVRDPVYGRLLELAELAELQPGQPVALAGKRQRLRIGRLARGLRLEPDREPAIDLRAGDVLEVLAPPRVAVAGSTERIIQPDELIAAFDAPAPRTVTWRVRERGGLTGRLTAGTDVVELAPAEPEDAVVAELAFVAGGADAVEVAEGRTTIRFASEVTTCFDRATVLVNANVAPATHGETVEEVLGGGDASRPYQRFTLKQAPLTHVAAATPTGAGSTLEVRVNDLLWREVPSLLGQGPNDRVYVTRATDDGRTVVEFGDGVTGARLPTGRDNVRARYRKGLGLGGLLKAGQLSQLMTRPLGVKEATNPAPAAGAADPEVEADARENAPITVLTLDRTVSLLDYEDFARGFGGIAKAHASWGWDRGARRILVTVAGPGGAEIEETGDTYRNLVAAIAAAGDPFVSVAVRSYRRATFRVRARVKVDEPTNKRDAVVGAVDETLRRRFSFAARRFGQPVAPSEVIAAIQGVPGIVAVDLDGIERTEQPAVPGPAGAHFPAVLLTLDPAPVELGLMP